MQSLMHKCVQNGPSNDELDAAPEDALNGGLNVALEKTL